MLNPVLNTDDVPVCMESEFFLLRRDDVDFHAKNGDDCFHLKGRLFLSNLRVVVVHGQSQNIRAFDLPLYTMKSEAFHQPIFGANYLSGENPPLDGSELRGNIKWELKLLEGGTGTFLPLFFRALALLRTPDITDEPTLNKFACSVYYDPADTSILYIPANSTAQ